MMVEVSWLSGEEKDPRKSIEQGVKSSLSSSPITGSFWAGLATSLVTCILLLLKEPGPFFFHFFFKVIAILAMSVALTTQDGNFYEQPVLLSG